MEEKRKAFKRVAERRVRKLLDGYRLLGNCANTHNYAYSEQDVKKMLSELERAAKRCKALFDDGLDKTKETGFKF